MIGVFDSGIGGLTVVRAIARRFPDHDIVYLGDTARTPYGNKSAGTVSDYAAQDMEFLLSRNARLVVVACNTVASVATDRLRRAYQVPVLEVITPAVEAAVALTRNRVVGVIGTRTTISSGVYEREIRDRDPRMRVFSHPCPLLVPLVEEGWVGKPETARIVKKYLLPLKTRQVDTLILGCTHYPLLIPVISRKMGRRVTVIDSSGSVARSLGDYLDRHPETAAGLTRNGTIELFATDLTPQFERTAQRILRRRVSLTHAAL